MPEYEPCKFCGGERILNHKTGKVFCKAKCWLNKSPQPQKATPLATSGNKEVLDAIRIVNSNIKIMIGEFRSFAQIFGEKQKDDMDVKKLDL